MHGEPHVDRLERDEHLDALRDHRPSPSALTLAWAKTLARLEGKSLSAVVTESLAERRRLAALAEVVAWMAEAQPPLTDDELNAAQIFRGSGTPHFPPFEFGGWGDR